MSRKNRQIRIASVQELTEEECEILADVSRRAFAEYKGDNINFRDAEMTAAQLHGMCADMTFFIMYIDGVVVGYSRGFLQKTAEGIKLWCEGNCSLPEYRRYSPGVMLAKAREKWAIERGATYGVLCTSCLAKKAIRYHHANGYRNWYYTHLAGKNYNSIGMRKDYGKPLSEYRRLKHLFRTWLQVAWRYKSDGSPRFHFS